MRCAGLSASQHVSRDALHGKLKTDTYIAMQALRSSQFAIKSRSSSIRSSVRVLAMSTSPVFDIAVKGDPNAGILADCTSRLNGWMGSYVIVVLHIPNTLPCAIKPGDPSRS